MKLKTQHYSLLFSITLFSQISSAQQPGLEEVIVTAEEGTMPTAAGCVDDVEWVVEAGEGGEHRHLVLVEVHEGQGGHAVDGLGLAVPLCLR